MNQDQGRGGFDTTALMLQCTTGSNKFVLIPVHQIVFCLSQMFFSEMDIAKQLFRKMIRFYMLILS